MKGTSRKLLCVCLSVMLTAAMSFTTAFADETEQQTEVKNTEKDIAIIYTSDINSEVTSNLALSGMVAYGNDLKAAGRYVEYADCGNALTGNVLAALSRGEYALEAMNIAGFGIAVPGSRELSYGVSRFVNVLAPSADYKYISCNFRNTEDGKNVFKPYIIKKYGNTKVAFVGITDPLTQNSGAAGLKKTDGTYAYTFGITAAQLYEDIQAAADNAILEGAQYVVALGNLSSESGAFSTEAVIAATSGINCFINGSEASTESFLEVKDKDGKAVLLTNPGENLESFGVLTISPSNNTLSTQLIRSYNYRNTSVKDEIDELTASYNTEMKTAFAAASTKLEVSDSTGVRIIESQETNFGDLTADAYRYVTGADIAVVGASEIGANIPIGSVSYKDITGAISGGKGISVVEITGLDLMDLLEMSVRLYPERNAEFLQVSGLTYDINETVIPSVETDIEENFVAVNGDYRITNIMINGRAIDLLRTYTLAASEELIDGLTGYTMLASARTVKRSVTTDNLAVITYIRDGLSGSIGAAYDHPQGRMDVIKLARQSVINAEIEAKINEKIKNYSAEIQALKAQLELQEKVIAVKSMTLTASSKYTKTSGKRRIKVSWKVSDDITGVKYQVYKSTKKTSGFKKLGSTSNKYYNNTSSLKKGKTYYYKVRAYIYTGGKYYYSNWSSVISRKVTS